MKTPRTDAERRVLKKAKSYPVDPVSAEFARQLEAELAAITALADRLAEALDTCASQLGSWHGLYESQVGADDVSQTLDAEEALAAYEAHKKGNTP